MELLQVIIVIESLVLALLLGIAAFWFYSRSRRIMDLRVFGLLVVIWFYCMPGILGAFSPTVLRVVIPLERPRVMLPVALSIPLLVLSVLAGLLIRWGPAKRLSVKGQRKLMQQIPRGYRLDRLFLYSAICLALALIGAWKELHAVGWLGVIHGGSQAYLEARVTGVLGIWGVPITLFPVAALGLMYCAVHGRVLPRGLRMLAAVVILCGSVGVVALLTTRHLIVMLLLSLVALFEIKNRQLSRPIVPIAIALIAVGAFALATFRYSSHTQFSDELTGNFEHIEIADRIVATVHITGYIWGGNIPDLVTFAIPRALWPNKPLGSRIIRTVFFEYAKEGGVKVPGMIGEAYASAGLVGVVLEGFIYGVLLRRLAAFWNRRRDNSLLFASFGALLVGFIYTVMRIGLIGPHDSTFLAVLLQIYLMNRLCGHRVREAVRDSARIIPATASPVTTT